MSEKANTIIILPPFSSLPLENSELTRLSVRTPEAISNYNRLVEEELQDRTTGIRLVDMESDIAGIYFNPAGYHPNIAGNHYIATKLLEAIEIHLDN